MTESPTWMTRALRIILVSEWVALIIGIAVTATAELGLGNALSAAVLGGGFVVASTLIPADRIFSPGLQFEILVIAGAVLTVAALTLTGGADSPYLLLGLTPTLLSALAGGFRVGLTTGLLSGGLVAAVTFQTADFEAVLASTGAIALFPLMALLVAQIRLILVEAEERAVVSEEASLLAEAEVSRLSQANQLLERLTDVYADGSANPVEVGRSALRAIVEANPGSFATATLFDSQGPVVVARTGTDSPGLVRSQFPLGDGETTSGVVSIATAGALGDTQRSSIDRLLRPVAVSFANAVLLQDIAGAAVHEERLRLARELHDEVGPALAALGLALDGARVQATDPAQDRSLGQVREGLGTVVDDIRGIIADLRSEETGGSLSAGLRAAAADLAPRPTLDIDIHERQPPRRGVGRQLSAIVTEAVRNAYRHAEAETVTVTGFVDRDRVSIEVADDGKGFDPAHLPEGHYGILGMRERADRIGASVDIDSGRSGTALRVAWKEKR